MLATLKSVFSPKKVTSSDLVIEEESAESLCFSGDLMQWCLVAVLMLLTCAVKGPSDQEIEVSCVETLSTKSESPFLEELVTEIGRKDRGKKSSE